MGYTVVAKLTVTARINVSASDPREAEIEAEASSVLDWEILEEPYGKIVPYSVVEVIRSEPNGPDYEPELMMD